MENVLKIKDDSRSNYFTPFILGISCIVLFSLLFQITNHSFTVIFGLLGVASVAIFFIPIEYSIFSFYFYLFLDGAIKINTNYNPIFHVAQDLILVALLARSVVDTENGGILKFFRTPFISLVFIFSVWIIIQYMNPFGLGLLPSIAGTKVYFSGILIFLLSYQHLRKSNAENILVFLTMLGLAEGMLATIEYLFFQGFVFTLHPKYSEIAGDSFSGDLFRPFGTTAAPGAPSMWIFLTAGFAMYLLLNSKRKWPKAIAIAHLVFSVPTLIFCQTRAAMILTSMNVLIVLFCPHGGITKRIGLIACFTLVVSYFLTTASFQSFSNSETPTDNNSLISSAQLKMLEDRAFSLVDKSAMTKARGGAFDEVLNLAESTTFGIGLSRVGAASAVWSSRIQNDKYFTRKWSFADNLYRAVFTELGIFGLFFWLILILAIATSHLKNSFRKDFKESAPLLWLCGVYPIIMLIGGFGSEGILYNPTSGFFWLLLAIGLKEVSSVSTKT